MTITEIDSKDPDSVEPITFDFTDRLAEMAGDEIDTLVGVAIDRGDDALVLGDSELATPYVTQWLSGGTLHSRYIVRARVTTTEGRTLDMSVKFKIKED
jgi:hypothetical protein